jgi:hypothetical protein
LRTAAVLFCVALLTLLALQLLIGINPVGQTLAPHFVFQAESFLHGRWDVSMPPGTTDTAVVHGKVYILYPPFPALLLMPFVAIFGRGMSDVLFTTIIASANLPLLYLLFEQARANGWSRRPAREHAYLSILLYFGSINLWLSLGGCMWFTGQVVAFSCTALSLLLAFRRRFGWSALLLGGAFLSRATLVMGIPLLVYLAWDDAGADPRFRRFLRSVMTLRPDWHRVPWHRLAPALGPLAAAGAFSLLRNFVMFGSPLESGYGIVLRQQYPAAKFGAFSLRYVPTNILASFFTFPRIEFAGPQDLHPTIDMLNHGIAVSMFVTTPLFLFLLWRNSRTHWLRAMLWITLGLLLLVILPFHEAGWYQFGARYLYDGYPYAFLVLVLNEMPLLVGAGRFAHIDWRITALGLLGIVINLIGAWEFWFGVTFHL